MTAGRYHVNETAFYHDAERIDERLAERVFFFQAEDGIRDLYVTGVQTCALPICRRGQGPCGRGSGGRVVGQRHHRIPALTVLGRPRPCPPKPAPKSCICVTTTRNVADHASQRSEERL